MRITCTIYCVLCILSATLPAQQFPHTKRRGLFESPRGEAARHQGEQERIEALENEAIETVPEVKRPFKWAEPRERVRLLRDFSVRKLSLDEKQFLSNAKDTLLDPLATWTQRERAALEIAYIGHCTSLQTLREVLENRFDRHEVRQAALEAFMSVGSSDHLSDLAKVLTLSNLLDDPQLRLESNFRSILGLTDEQFSIISREGWPKGFPQDSPELRYYMTREPGMGYGSGNEHHLSLRTDNAIPVHHIQWLRGRKNRFLRYWSECPDTEGLDFTKAQLRELPKAPESVRVVDVLGIDNDLVGLYSKPADVIVLRIPTREYWPPIEPLYMHAASLGPDDFRRMADEAEKSKDMMLPPLGVRDIREWNAFADRKLNGYELTVLDYAARALLDPDLRWAFRIDAAEKIGRIGSINGIGPLRNVIRNWYDHRLVRMECIRAVRKIADRLVIPILIDTLANPRVAVEAHRQLLRVCGDPLQLEARQYEVAGTTREEYGYQGYGFNLRGPDPWGSSQGSRGWELADEFMLEYRSNNEITLQQVKSCLALHKRYKAWWGDHSDTAKLNFAWRTPSSN